MMYERLEYLSSVRQMESGELRAALGARGFDVVVFDGEAVTGAPALLAEFGHQMGMSDEMQPTGWDGFRDAAFEVMVRSGSEQVALLWENSHRLLTNDLQDFLKATTILHGVAISTRRARGIESYTFLLGDVPGYRSLDQLFTDG